MKRILISTVLSLILLPSVFAADNTELLDQDTSQIATPSFSYTTFGSCSEFESTMKRILPKTNGGYYGRGGGIMYATEDALKSSVPTASPGIVAEKATASPEPYSTTNTQVLGVDEADTVKTDGKYLYSFQENDHVIAILDAKTLVKIKSIRIPTTYYGVTFYLTKNKLIVTATKSNPYSARWYGWYDNEQKSIVALYDISNPLQASLSRVIQVDGSLSDSRVADDGMMTVVVSTSYWTPPIYRMYSQTDMDSKSLDYSSRTLIPRISDMVLTTKGAYKTTARTVADCSRMGSILPDAKSLDAFSFSPTLTSILRFDTSVPAGLITSQVVLSEAGQIHLSKQSIYLTSNMWLPRQTPCPKGAMCMMPLWYNPGTSTTLVHRFAFAGINTNYVYSKSIPGSPLSQYSMDEDGSRNFRIVTSESGDKQSTRVSILDPKGGVLGSLTGLAPGENFQSSRFIADRLYLVTFQQIDPLFVIGLTDPKNPVVLGELKIPGYSTYLHPYDADRLIGIGYNTITNQWGGTQNGGLKVDLYNVRDIKDPKLEQSLTIGDAGSSSEVLTNPRAFVWYKEKNLLLMPATIMQSANDPVDTYRYQSAYQGVIGVSITPNAISEKFRVTHIKLPATVEAEWKKECAQYTAVTTKPVCRKLLDGSDYCTSPSTYVPNYCFQGSTVETYFASQLWSYSTDFISRALYVGESFYTFGASKIRKWNFANTSTPTAEALFSTRNTPYGVPMPIDAMVK